MIEIKELNGFIRNGEFYFKTKFYYETRHGFDEEDFEFEIDKYKFFDELDFIDFTDEELNKYLNKTLTDEEAIEILQRAIKNQQTRSKIEDSIDNIAEIKADNYWD